MWFIFLFFKLFSLFLNCKADIVVLNWLTKMQLLASTWSLVVSGFYVPNTLKNDPLRHFNSHGFGDQSCAYFSIV